MGQFGGYYKGEKKKPKKKELEKRAGQIMNKKTYTIPEIEIIKKNKNEW